MIGLTSICDVDKQTATTRAKNRLLHESQPNGAGQSIQGGAPLPAQY